MLVVGSIAPYGPFGGLWGLLVSIFIKLSGLYGPFRPWYRAFGPARPGGPSLQLEMDASTDYRGYRP